MSIDEFLDGETDCRNGVPHQTGKSDSYDDGYSYQYWCEQQQTNRNLKQEKK